MPASQSEKSARPEDQLTELRQTQHAMITVLLDKDEALAKMYHGAIKARSFVDNPEYLAQASHSIRELIDNLPKYFDVCCATVKLIMQAT